MAAATELVRLDSGREVRGRILDARPDGRVTVEWAGLALPGEVLDLGELVAADRAELVAARIARGA